MKKLLNRFLNSNKVIIWGGLTVFPIFFLLWFAFTSIPDPLFMNDYSTVFQDRNGNITGVYLNSDEQWIFPPSGMEKIPEKLETAVILAEDMHFYRHVGINPLAIARAVWQNLRKGEIVSGASTITMQVARLMKPKSRTYIHKMVEIFQALKIEIKYTKKDILRFYLSHAPYGGNIIGIQAASWKYYRKPPESLTWGEAATLSVLPNAPGIISPVVNRDILLKKRNSILKKLHEKGILSNGEYLIAVNEPVPSKTYSFPVKTPHLNRFLKKKHGSSVTRTSIDSDVQYICQSILKTHAHFLEQRGIYNISLLVAETGSGKIRAYAGSQDFFNKDHGGEVDGVMAFRSTGSILKPFLYGMAMDRGLLLPDSILQDIPTSYGSFTPSNADKKFDGIVRVKEALIRSLNVPAARTLQKTGIDEFYQFLKSAGVKHLNEPGQYGLTLVLGGAECRLLDMVSLYRGLGNFGEFRHLVFLEDKTSKSEPEPLLSKGASWLTLDILKNLKRPGSEYYWELFENSRPLAWKTGTSYGRRDAWAIGVSPQWTIGVWVGNFTGEGNPYLGGASCAGPVLFDVFNSLPLNEGFAWFEKPKKEMVQISLCADTGYQADLNCKNIVAVSVPINMKPLNFCNYHKKLHITVDNKSSVCSLCWLQGKYKTENRLIYPAEVMQVLRKRGVSFDTVPPHNTECSTVSSINPISIIYPTDQAEIILPRDFGGQKQKITAKAAHMNRNSKVYWYLNKKYLGETSEDHSLSLTLLSGKYSLVLVDENGNRSGTSFSVYTHR